MKIRDNISQTISKAKNSKVITKGIEKFSSSKNDKSTIKVGKKKLDFKESINVLVHNKKSLYILISIFLVIVMIVISIFVYNDYNKNRQQNKLEKELVTMGKTFYEDFYYKQIESTDLATDTFLAKFKTIGIKINLDSLGRYNNSLNKDTVAGFVNDKTGEACDKLNTMLIIYPTDPYGKKNYTYKVVLSCGFEKE